MVQVDNYTNSLEELGYKYFGPLIFNYFNWLKTEIDDCDKILFNSREGLFLQEIYELFKEKYNLWFQQESLDFDYSHLNQKL